MTTIRRRFTVSGKVQGVFYREGAKGQADMLGLNGWAKNLADGRVELVVEGDANAIERFARWAKEGSTRSKVTAVDAVTEVPEGLGSFRTI